MEIGDKNFALFVNDIKDKLQHADVQGLHGMASMEKKPN